MPDQLYANLFSKQKWALSAGIVCIYLPIRIFVSNNDFNTAVFLNKAPFWLVEFLVNILFFRLWIGVIESIHLFLSHCFRAQLQGKNGFRRLNSDPSQQSRQVANTCNTSGHRKIFSDAGSLKKIEDGIVTIKSPRFTFMKIHIMGASCAGSTTLGNALAAELNIPYFDTDTYFWEPSVVPYTVKRNPELRNQMLKEDLAKQNDWILGGSMISWGNEWKEMFSLVVFLYVPKEIRLRRLVSRELDRYGNAIYVNPKRAALFKEFLNWASRYDDVTFTGRSIRIHEDWLKQVPCQVLEIRGDTTVEERVMQVTEAIS